MLPVPGTTSCTEIFIAKETMGLLIDTFKVAWSEISLSFKNIWNLKSWFPIGQAPDDKAETEQTPVIWLLEETGVQTRSLKPARELELACTKQVDESLAQILRSKGGRAEQGHEALRLGPVPGLETTETTMLG
jgi:hypothetical protein